MNFYYSPSFLENLSQKEVNFIDIHEKTLFHTPEENEGKRIWKDRTGERWPYNGWWGKSESIDPEINHLHLK